MEEKGTSDSMRQ